MFFQSHRHNEAARRAAQLLPWQTNVLPAPGRTHPWQVRPVWISKEAMPAGGYWVAVIEAGLVNGLPAAVRMTVADLNEDQKARVKAEAEAARRPMPPDTAQVDVFVDEQAQLRLNWRRIGAGATGTTSVVNGEPQTSYEPVPLFFRNLGVQNAAAGQAGYESTPTQGVRYLAASDLVLNQPRVATQSEVIVGAAVDGTIVSVQPTYLVPPDRQPMVVSFAKFDPPPPPTLTPRDLFFAPFQELLLDQLHLCTLYALSPWNPASDQVNGNWALYFKYNIHWNLAHASRIAEAVRVQPLTLFTGLAAGVGDTLFNFILSSNNDYAQAAANLIIANNQGGRFYAV